MVGFEMISPWTGTWPPQQDRYRLRREFERWLPKPELGQARYQGESVDEASLIELCRRYRLEYVGASGNVLRAWDDCPERINEKCPSSQELRARGWLQLCDGRWTRSRPETEESADTPLLDSRTEDFLDSLDRLQFVDRGHHRDLSASAQKAKEQLELQPREGLPARDAQWLVRRLWSELHRTELPDAGDATEDDESEEDFSEGEEHRVSQTVVDELVDRAFLQWQIWCGVVHGWVEWDPRWNAAERRHCREAALRVLDRQETWPNWGTVEAQISAANGGAAVAASEEAVAQRTVSGLSCSLVNRHDRLNWPDVQQLVMRQLQEPSSVGFAFSLLFSEMEKTAGGTRIEATVKSVMDLVAGRPLAMQHLVFKVHSAPVLLVDMLLSERTTALATKIIVRWRNPEGRQTEHRAVRDGQARTFAIQDALSILAFQLQFGRLDHLELASLITWAYASRSHSSQEDSQPTEPVGRALLELLAGASDDDQSIVLRHLMEQAGGEGAMPRGCFAGVLEAAELLPVAGHVDLTPVAALYARFARDLALDRTDVAELPESLSARLIQIDSSESTSAEDSVLQPFDPGVIAREAFIKGDHRTQYCLSKTLRIHVQVLARAVAGWPDKRVPQALSSALLQMMERGVTEDSGEGRVAALTERYAPTFGSGKEQGSPARDLAKAWRRLDASQQNKFLEVMVGSDDPSLLAEFSKELPYKAKEVVRTRLQELGPEHASDAWTWPEMIRRIDRLLDADEFVVARQHLDEVEKLTDRGRPEIKFDLFRLRLRLLLSEKSWVELDELVIPPALDDGLKIEAEQALAFTRATSQLLRSDGDVAGAKAKLERLAARRRSASSYRENAYAASMRLLLGDGIGPLSGEAKGKGEALLAEMMAMVDGDKGSSSLVLIANIGLLLVALERPEEALELLRSRSRRDKDVAYVTALAMSKLEDVEDAVIFLDLAIDEFGPDASLLELRKTLDDGETAKSVPLVATQADPLSSIRMSLEQLKNLRPGQIGEVLAPVGEGLRGYLIGVVSKAVASLQHMVAILRRRTSESNDAKLENDLTTAVREILGAHLAFIRWDVADQSLGGFTARRNPGERDLVIRTSGQEVAILEALVCTSVNRGEIKKHFHKALDYGKCRIYFQVIYSYTAIDRLLDYVKDMIESEVPPRFEFRSCAELSPEDYETAGCVATYANGHDEVSVIFLIVDLNVPRSEKSADDQ